MNFMVTHYSEASAFKALKKEWNRLLQESVDNNIFLTWEWNYTWWKVYGSRYSLFLVTVRDNDGILLCIAPLKITYKRHYLLRKMKTLEFIGFGEDVTPEYLNFIIKMGYEKQVNEAVFSYIKMKSKCEVYDLRSISSGVIKQYMSDAAKNSQASHYRIDIDSKCPIADLPASLEEYYGGKSKNFKKKMKEDYRRIDRELEPSLIRSNNQDDLEFHYSQLIKLHHDRWKKNSNAFKNEQYIEFHRKICEQFLNNGWLRLYMLFDADRPIAGIYCFFYNKQYSYYQSGRDMDYSRYRVGTVLLNRVVEESIKEGANCFDFLTGTEPYKFRWCNRVRTNYRAIYWKNKKKYNLSKRNTKAVAWMRMVFGKLKKNK